MVTTHPVAVGKVDADGGGRIEVAGNDGTLDDLCTDAATDGLAEAGVDRTVVLEPLRVGAQDLRTGGSR